MVALQYRIRRTIARQGETFTVSGISHTGIFTTITPGAARRYLTDAVIDTSPRPIYAIYVADDDTTTTSDTISYDGMSLSVLKVLRRRFRGVVVYQLVLARE